MTKPADAPQSVLLIGYYGYQNLGDSLFLKLILERIEAMAPSGTRVFVKDFLPSKEIACGLEVVSLPFDATLAFSEMSRLKRAVKFYRLLRHSMSRVGIVVYGGGSLFHSRDLRNLIVLIAINHVARRSPCKIIAVGMGIPSPEGILRRTLLKRVLSQLDTISVRDSTSHEVCTRVSPTKPCILASDLAFLEAIPELSIEPSRDVVFTISASDFHSMDRLSQIASKVAEALEAVVDAGSTLGFMSFQEYESTTIKVSDSEMLFRLLGDRNAMFDGNRHVPRDYRAAIGVVAHYKCLAGMRFHSLVAAASLRKPFIGLGDDPKLVALCEAFAMPHIPLDHFSSESLLKAIHTAHWTTVQDAALERQRMLAVENEAQLAEVFQ